MKSLTVITQTFSFKNKKFSPPGPSAQEYLKVQKVKKGLKSKKS